MDNLFDEFSKSLAEPRRTRSSGQPVGIFLVASTQLCNRAYHHAASQPGDERPVSAVATFYVRVLQEGQYSVRKRNEELMPELHNPRSHKNPEDCHSDLEARDEALGTFRDLVKTSFDPREVEKWVRTSPIRQVLFDDMAVGQIRWPRSLGRPDAPNLFDGFVIKTTTWADIWHVGLDGSIVVDLLGWIPGTPSDLRDRLSEPDHYSVQYLFQAAVDRDNQVEVQFSDLPWHYPGRSAHLPQLYMSSHGYQFFSSGTFVALPDITVDGRPFFHP